MLKQVAEKVENSRVLGKRKRVRETAISTVSPRHKKLPGVNPAAGSYYMERFHQGDIFRRVESGMEACMMSVYASFSLAWQHVSVAIGREPVQHATNCTAPDKRLPP
ncbi:unnamed protein product [Nezara viridula]|uniref:Uncharacterized protein n=1 Tax=Nezara viridula TaxID=85310 RepID=A0A9P0HC49_NEZVI|nr:unnamed protein product [Nezara viridula]